MDPQHVCQYTDCAILIAQIVESQVLLQSTNHTLKLHCPMSVEKINTSLVNDYQDVDSQ